MKNLNALKVTLLLVLSIMMVSSCETSEFDSEIKSTQEGFMSTTANSDTVIENDDSIVTKPLLHMSFDGSLSKEEASTKFSEAVTKYMNENTKLNKGVTNDWVYRVYTYTGTGVNNQTDGFVRFKAKFRTNLGYNQWTPKVELNNPGNDREQNQWDFYLLNAKITGGEVSWVEFADAFIELQGTDGWYMQYFWLFVLPEDQAVAATGRSEIFEGPVWLDSTTSSGWDSYHYVAPRPCIICGGEVIGKTGRLNF